MRMVWMYIRALVARGFKEANEFFEWKAKPALVFALIAALGTWVSLRLGGGSVTLTAFWGLLSVWLTPPILLTAALWLGLFAWSAIFRAPFQRVQAQTKELDMNALEIGDLKNQRADAQQDKHRDKQRTALRLLLNVAVSAGGVAMTGHDDAVQDEWASRTQKIIVKGFGLGESMRFITADKTAPDISALWGIESRDAVIRARLAYLQSLLDRFDALPVCTDFDPDEFDPMEWP